MENHGVKCAKTVPVRNVSFIPRPRRGEDKTWTPGPWTPSLDRVHGPPSWTRSMDPLHGPGPWTPIFFYYFSVSFPVFCFLLFVFFIFF